MLKCSQILPKLDMEKGGTVLAAQVCIMVACSGYEGMVEVRSVGFYFCVFVLLFLPALVVSVDAGRRLRATSSACKRHLITAFHCSSLAWRNYLLDTWPGRPLAVSVLVDPVEAVICARSRVHFDCF